MSIPAREWIWDGKCVTERIPEHQFDVDARGYKGLAAQREARRLCAGCPVMKDCAGDALLTGDSGVVRGGVALNTNLGPATSLKSVARLMYVKEYGKPPSPHDLHWFMQENEIPSYAKHGVDYRGA